jgi:outer membrane protein OmpA-like peptidoglycan-associated protein
MRLRSLGVLVALILAAPDVRPAEACGIKLVIRGKAMARGKQLVAKRGAANAVAGKETEKPIAAGPARAQNDGTAKAAPLAAGRGDTVAVVTPPRPKQPPVVKSEPVKAQPQPQKTEPQKIEPVASTEPEKVTPEKVTPEKATPPEKVTPEKIEKPAPAPAPVATAAPAIEIEVFFEYGAATVTDESVLDGAVTWLKDNPKATLVLEGFADPSGPDGANLALSARRAEAVKQTLMTKAGASAKRFKIVSHGEKKLAYPEDDGRNRRVLLHNR